MNAIPAYEREPCRRELEVEVRATGEESGRSYAVLDDTLLYPEGGGQPADRGTLAEVAVVDVQRRDGELRHYLASPVAAGSAHLRLDWSRRFDHMQQHTAQHLLSALAADRHGWPTTSFHLGERASDVELAAPVLPAEGLAELEEEIAAEVRAARPVSARRVTAEEFSRLPVRTRGLPAGHRGDVRLVEIAGVDLSACGGTHLRSTAEIEAVKLLGTEPMRGGVRLHFVAGGRARRRLAEQEGRVAELRRLLEAPEAELPAAAAARLEQLRDLQRRLRRLEERWVDALVEGLAARARPLADLHLDDTEGAALQRLAGLFRERSPRGALFATATSEKGSTFVLAAGAQAALDVRTAGAQIADLLAGRGGGSPGLYQGRAGSLARRAEALVVLQRAAGPSADGVDR